MSEPERPLHVLVAEALGWSCRPPRPHEKQTEWYGDPHRQGHWGWSVVPHYDQSWRITGPLIEKYVYTLANGGEALRWSAYAYDHKAPSCHGATPLEAVCKLILALKEANKL